MATAVPAVALGGIALGTGVANAATVEFTSVTHVVNDPDSGGAGNTWAIDNFTRTMTVTDVGPTSTANVEQYSAVVTDKGTFVTLAGVKAPDQNGADAGTTVTHKVPGIFAGTAHYSFTAPAGSVTAASKANVATYVNDDDLAATGVNATGEWWSQAFPVTDMAVPNEQRSAVLAANGANVLANDWTWTYKTATQSWTDSFANGDGQNAVNDGNITGTLPKHPVPPVLVSKFGPHLTHGHIITVSNTRAELGWTYADYGKLKECAVTQTFGFNMTAANGAAHKGFTCYNPSVDAPNQGIGFWSGLAAGHTYDISFTPAYANGTPIPHAPVGWINVVTTK
jgi:hypothetical protein